MAATHRAQATAQPTDRRRCRALHLFALHRGLSERARVALPPELLKRTFSVDVETCPRCGGRMRLLAVITDLQSVARFLRHRGELHEPPARAPPRDPPYFKTQVVRRRQPTETSPQQALFEEH